MSLEIVKMVVRERRDVVIRPVHLKFGLALAISVGGIIYAFIRTRKRIKPPKSKPCQGNGSQADSREENVEDDLTFVDSSLRRVYSQNSLSDRSSSSRRSEDRDAFLLPEFHELVQECNMSIMDDISPTKNERKCTEHDDEIRGLQTKVKICEERGKNLENQLLEYQEQESAVMELRNRLRLNSVEAKLYNLKIESLVSDNRRLEAQLADYAKVVAELEAAKAKTKQLRKKLKTEAEQNKEQILTLQDRVMKLQDQERKAAEMDQELGRRELEEMKKSNEVLKQENANLLQKLEYVQMLAPSALDAQQVQQLREEARCLRQHNEDLEKEMERLEADRLSDLEELVYLRWISACLRYEAKNSRSSTGKAMPKDMSKNLSPKSEEKIKQIILEYAHKEGSRDKGMDMFPDFDSDHCSSSVASCLTDSGEHDDLAVDAPSSAKPSQSSKTRVFSKLRKLLTGKGSSRQSQATKSGLERAVSVDSIASRHSSTFQPRFSVSSVDDMMKSSRNSSSSSSRRSLDLQRSCSRSQKSMISTAESSNGSRRISDVGTSSTLARINSLTEEDDSDWFPGSYPNQDVKEELLKYAESLRNARTKSLERKSVSLESH